MVVVLGGSFNPPHAGHLYITKKAMSAVSARRCLWLVTPQNPFKVKSPPSPLSLRMLDCLNLIKSARMDGFIVPSDIEKKFKTTQTYNTIRQIKTLLSKFSIYWLMGLDNLEHFHTWKMWTEIINPKTGVNVIIANRGESSDYYRLFRSKTVTRYKKNISFSGSFCFKGFWGENLMNKKGSNLGCDNSICVKQPQITILKIKPNKLSSTKIRNNFTF